MQKSPSPPHAKAHLPFSTPFMQKPSSICPEYSISLQKSPGHPPPPSLQKLFQYMSKVFHNPCKNPPALLWPLLTKALWYMSKIFHDPWKSPLALLHPPSCKSPLIYVWNSSWPIQKSTNPPLPHPLQNPFDICLNYFNTLAKVLRPSFTSLSLQKPINICLKYFNTLAKALQPSSIPILAKVLPIYV